MRLGRTRDLNSEFRGARKLAGDRAIVITGQIPNVRLKGKSHKARIYSSQRFCFNRPVPAAPCTICESLGSGYVAQTGYGHGFPAAYDQLKKVQLGLSSDLLLCPGCEAVFFWEDHTQLFGSGNLDEEELTRLADEPAQVVRELFRLPDDAISASDLLLRAFELVPESPRDLVLSHLRNKRNGAFEQLLPALLDRLHETNDATLRSFLVSYCYDGTIRCAAVLKLLEADPRLKNTQSEELSRYCRKSIGLP